MSADNIIYIRKSGDKWKVWEQSASIDPIREPKSPEYTGEEAVNAAIQLRKSIGCVEYGITILETGECTACGGDGAKMICPSCV